MDPLGRFAGVLEAAMNPRRFLYLALAMAVPLVGLRRRCGAIGLAAGQRSGPPGESASELRPDPDNGYRQQNGQQPNGPAVQPILSAAGISAEGTYPQQGYPQQLTPYPQQDEGYPQQGYDQPAGYGQQGYPPAQPLGAAQLEQLVAPIALYPDSLVAEILTASTYPAQVSAAAQWIESMQGASPDQVAAAASAQTGWDPSVRALTAFPQVLEWLAGRPAMGHRVGQCLLQPAPGCAGHHPGDAAAGRSRPATCSPTPQEQVSDDQGNIEIAPTNPDDVYVPTYDPWTAYGAPVPAYPGFNFLSTVGSFIGPAVQFGMSFGMGAFMHTPFGLLAWGLDWLGHSILFNHGAYWTHSREMRDWGFAHGGPRWGGRELAGNRGYGGLRNRGSFAENYRHQPMAIHGGEYGRSGYGNSYAGRGTLSPYSNRGYGNAFAGRQPEYGRGGYGAYGRMPAPARPEAYAGRPQAYGGYGGARQLARNYGGERGFSAPARPAMGSMGRPGGYGGPQAYRGGETYGGRQLGGESRGLERGYAGRSYGGEFARQPKSGGSHFFGGGHSSSGFSSRSSRGFEGGGHSFSGGHSSHGFGGSRHSSGGGHGGHSGGHGGGHRR